MTRIVPDTGGKGHRFTPDKMDGHYQDSGGI